MLIKDPNNNLQKMIVTAVNLLRDPVGNKYSSPQDIQNNRNQFIKDYHRGLYDLHIVTVDVIIDLEKRMLASKDVPPRKSKTLKKKWIYVRQLLRCINDAIIWTAYPHDPGLFVRRICRNQERGKLTDQNPESILTVMKHLFANGQCLPIWNDATRCVDISDITLFSPPKILFIEVKSGRVNSEINNMMNEANNDKMFTNLNKFFERYGICGVNQIDRIIKQTDRASKLVKLVKHDNVYDPFLNRNRIAISSSKSFDRYDTELKTFFQEIHSRDFVDYSIDNCLHVLALNRSRGISIETGRKIVNEYYQRKMAKTIPDQVSCSDVVMSLSSCFEYPESMPIMLRSWSPEDIAKISLGHIEVYFGFDINAWAKHFQVARLTWSDKKQGKAEFRKPEDDRLLVIDKRIPQLIGPKGRIISLGTLFLQVMLCEGIRPKSLAAFYDEIIDRCF